MPNKVLTLGILFFSIALSACGTNRAGFIPGHEPQFAKPANLGPKIELTKEMVAGNEYTFTDEIGPYWVRIGTNGFASGGVMGETKAREPAAAWAVRDGNLCLKGRKWWGGKGNCFKFYGGEGKSTKDATVMSPTYKRGPNSWYPASFAH